ncbi:helix-turn-helix domain-containing protein [Chryseobacterium sp. ISL-6]|uniref:helix-turn-helix domain-containing protein n=1 Tax=Chryseobacterium sp. ISL-6 TaxID=2819143 RepID=UPI001BED1CD3|nr:helix-turn-helix domain-containing protein [Chryseobacterium sp. ISL-6]MBT2621950.1 helix-turn-helix domain-containing protein [Chryseobacterium sp. ISL-6]
MEIDIITQKDLQVFKQELLKEIKDLIDGRVGNTAEREWLKSGDVRKMLKVSPGTLQNLRINGSLPYRKIGGSMYYRTKDIAEMMEQKEHDN